MASTGAGDEGGERGDGTNEQPNAGREHRSEVLIRTATRSWSRRFEISGAWPFVSASEVEERFEQLVRQRWVSSPGPASGRPAEGTAPPADVFVADGDIWVEVDLPGVAPESVRTRLEDGDLVIEAERLAAAPPRGARPAAVERPRGLLRRRLSLPRVPAHPRLEQRFEGGILQVRIRASDERP